MTSIPDDKLLEHANRARGKVVLITGGGSGIGKETALEIAQFGAKVAIGDRDLQSAENVVSEIQATGGRAVAIKCDVTVWDEVVDMYEVTLKEFGAVDIVVVNAGVGEVGGCCPSGPIECDESGRPKKPGTVTIEVNLIGVLYTVHLAQHYLNLNRIHPESLKAVVFLGSIASWTALKPTGAPVYVATKHAVLGLMRALDVGNFKQANIRTACIHPFYADTAIVPASMRAFLAGMPLVPVPRVAGAIIHAATNPDSVSNGAAYWTPGPGTTFLISKEEFKMGVYKLIDERSNALFRAGPAYRAQLLVNLMGMFWRPLLPVLLAIFLPVSGFMYRHKLYRLLAFVRNILLRRV